jgi:hypothetical protein
MIEGNKLIKMKEVIVGSPRSSSGSGSINSELIHIVATFAEGNVPAALDAILTFTDAAGTHTSRQSMTVSGTTMVAEFAVAIGIEYTVTTGAYLNVEQQTLTRTAAQEEYDILFDYTNAEPLATGVFIECTDGSLIRTEKWATQGAGKTAQDIAILTTSKNFRLSLTYPLTQSNVNEVVWGGYPIDDPMLANGIEGYDNKANTDNIIAYYNKVFWNTADADKPVPLTNKRSGSMVTLPETPAAGWWNADGSAGDINSGIYLDSQSDYGAPAAELCRTYSYCNIGKGGWDLPTARELILVASNLTAINEALTAVGATLLYTQVYHWSSSEYHSNFAYFVMLSSGSTTGGAKCTPCAVRPVADFDYKK